MQQIGEYLNGKQPEAILSHIPETAAPKVPEPAELAALDETWHPKVAQAISAARQWQQNKQNGRRYTSLILVASQMSDAAIARETGHNQGCACRDCQTMRVTCTGYGCGKTHIARAVLWSSRLICDGVPVAPLNQFMLADDLIQTMAREVPMSDIVNTANGHRPALIVDDVGSEKLIPFVSAGAQDGQRWALYFKAINYCYTNGCSVVLTANLTIEELKNHIGGRAWSRLLEMAPKGQIVDLTGVPDYRRKEGGR